MNNQVQRKLVGFNPDDYFSGLIYLEKVGKEIPYRLHRYPHIEEAASLDVVSREATQEFIDKFAPSGVLYIGCGGGALDDHNPKWREKMSALMIILKELKLERTRKWKGTLRFCHLNDTGGRKNPRDIGLVLKLMNYQRPDEEEENFNWALNGLWVKFWDIKKNRSQNLDYSLERIRDVALGFNPHLLSFDLNDWYKEGLHALAEDEIFFQKALEELEVKLSLKKVIIEEFECYGRHIRLAAIRSKNYKIGPAMRYKKGPLKANAIIVENIYGHTIIALDKNLNLNLRDVAAVLRVEEQMIKIKVGELKRMHTGDWSDLRLAHDVDGAEEWYYDQAKTGMIFNGSYTHPNVPKTKQSLGGRFNSVRAGLDPNFWVSAQCVIGTAICDECHWKSYGLPRCRLKRQRRFKENNIRLVK